MKFTTWADSMMKKMSWIDIAFVKLSSVAFGIILVILIPSLLGINVWLMVAIALILATRPVYTAFK